jgi:hypothetical protein
MGSPRSFETYNQYEDMMRQADFVDVQ